MGKKMERRDFLALMGLGGAAAATMSCSNSPNFDEHWHPWVEPVEGTIPYMPRHYATTTRESDGAGLWVTVLGGRATKLEGNPAHPINAGTLTARQQSTIQGLYEVDRVTKPRTKDGKELTWRQAEAIIAEKLAAAKGKNVSALTGRSTGAVNDIWTEFLAASGTGKLVQYEAFSQSDVAMASEKVFGQAAVPYVSLAGADMVVSLGAMFLESWGDVTAHNRNYADMRAPEHGKRGKHIQVEARISGTGANADSVIYAAPGSETAIALAVLKEVASHSAHLSDAEKAKVATLTADASLAKAAAAGGVTEDQLKQLVEALGQAEHAVVLPAESLSLGKNAVAHHAAVLLLNKALGGIGKHYNYSAAKPIEHVPSHKGVSDLVTELNSGAVELLLVKDANPVYSLPANIGFADAMGKAGYTIAFAETMNETVALADLIMPVLHDLECWGEVNTYAGCDMLQQPVMEPRWDARQAEDHLHEILFPPADPQKKPKRPFMDYLKSKWLTKFADVAGADTEKFWRDCLERGGLFNMAEAGENLALSGNLDDAVFTQVNWDAAPALQLQVVESARFGDGRYNNRTWMQELPDQMTSITWDSWLEMNMKAAKAKGLDYGDVVKVTAGGVSVELPVFLSETTSEKVVSFATGQGRKNLRELFDGRGKNAFAFLGSELNDGELFSAAPADATVSSTGGHIKLATIHLPGKGDKITTPLTTPVIDPGLREGHYDRDLYQTIAVGSLGHHGEGHGGGGHHEVFNDESKFPKHTQTNFYPDRGKDPVIWGRDETFYQNYKWELGIDLNKCTGCGSCVTACYAENNIPTVGKDQVSRGREMAWIRINRYLKYTDHHSEEVASVGFLPMMCQQCGNAPCESVCPSLATYHNKEGLNAMVYNRCVGTRYCANNCTYKVRRFNWFTFADRGSYPGDLNWQLNPAVSVREKGVMEKCTFCVQRLTAAKDAAKDEGRKVRDGEARTACQQACPAGAIEFGNASDSASAIAKFTHDERAYKALDSHIHTKPGVTYLQRVVLDEAKHHAGGSDHHGDAAKHHG